MKELSQSIKKGKLVINFFFQNMLNEVLKLVKMGYSRKKPNRVEGNLRTWNF